MNRANWIPAPHYYVLNMACLAITQAYGHHLYLVGSAIERRDYRDVDIRLILPDDDFLKLFPGISGGSSNDARWTLLCASISCWLRKQSDLPVDFQIQSQTDANAIDGRTRRHPIGFFCEPKEEAMPELTECGVRDALESSAKSANELNETLKETFQLTPNSAGLRLGL